MTVQEWVIQDGSKLGQLRKAVEDARTTHETATQRREAYVAEVAEIDAWIDMADETTKNSDYANKAARRSILLNLMKKIDQQLAELAEEVKPLPAEYSRMYDYYLESTRSLAAVNDLTNPITRRMSLNDIDQRKATLTAWLQGWTQPESELVEV